jgi:hypothetical protein
MSTDPARSSRIRSVAAGVVAILSLALVFFFIAVIAADPSLVSAWIGLLCFAFAAAGAIFTMETERRSRRR